MRALPGQLSERTRRAVQDYTALNTITRAVEAMQLATSAGRPTPPLALHIVAALADAEGASVRVPLACPLGRRMLAAGLLRYPAGGTRGILRRRVS